MLSSLAVAMAMVLLVGMVGFGIAWVAYSPKKSVTDSEQADLLGASAMSLLRMEHEARAARERLASARR